MPAALPPRPPDGTYVYEVRQGGATIASDRVVISASGSSVVVRDAATITYRNATAIATATFDAATLTQTAYAADFSLPGRSQHTTVSFAPGSVTVSVPGQTVPIAADASAPLELTGDNLADSFVMIPAVVRAHGVSAFTLAVLSGGLAVVTHVAPAPNATRPAGVPAGDAAMSVAFGPLDQTFWYDPATYRVDEVDIPAQGASIVLTSQSASVAGAPTPAPLETPVPLPPARFTSRDVHFTSADGTVLAGTLTIPLHAPARVPALIFVHGSGAEDRNETIGPNAVFLQLATALSNAGYAVLRYDKRGVGLSRGSYANSTRGDLLADARAALAFARAQSRVDPRHIFMLGHSEGGELVPSVAATTPGLAGIVLMAPPALPLAQVIMEQALESVPASQRAQTRREEAAALAAIRDGRRKGPGMAWLRTSLDVDPVTDIERLRIPILILQGAKDVQVLPADLPRLVGAARLHDRDVTARIFPNDNHLFMPVTPGEALTPQAAVDQYLSVPSYVDPAVLSTLIRWLNARAGMSPHHS